MPNKWRVREIPHWLPRNFTASSISAGFRESTLGPAARAPSM
jgi:hypothetical protein